MSTIATVAKAFVKGQPAKCHNAVTDGSTYRLHGHTIARRADGGTEPASFDWCGWYTPTTANHMNHIIKALGIPSRVSYAKARDAGIRTFFA